MARLVKEKNNLSLTMYKNILINYILRAITILIGLLSTNVNLSYLGMNLYGQWATIASIASWINYGDFGIGNGFRNEFAKAVAENDDEKKRKLLVSTAKMLGKLSVILFFVLMIVSEGLFLFKVMDSAIRIPMHITNLFFSIDLFLGIGRSAAYGYQKSWLTSMAQSITVLLRVLGVLALSMFPSNLILFAVVSGISGIIGNVFLIIYLNHKEHISFSKPINTYYDPKLKRIIMGMGVQFFVLQIAGLILYSSDNIIINRLIASEAVTKYDIITKIYNTGDSLFAIFLVSLWSAVTFAIAKYDYKWIVKELKRLLLFWGIFSVGVVVVSISFNTIIKVWLGKNAIIYEWPIILLFAVYTIWGTFGSIFVNVANGMGRLKIQLIFACIEAVVNIPLSVFFATNLSMGIFGVKLATLLCCIGANVFVPIDIYFCLKKIRSEEDK